MQLAAAAAFAVSLSIALFVTISALAELNVLNSPELPITRWHVAASLATVTLIATPILWAHRASLLYMSIRAFVQLLLNFFFRQITVVGVENIPASGPVIIVANHRNQFVDGGMMLVASPRPVRLTMAAASLARPVIGTFARGLGVIPVHRAQDDARPGSGLVSGAAGSTVLTGDADTRFGTELAPGATVLVGQLALVVATVVNDAELTLAAPLAAPLSPTAFKLASAKADHGQMFASVFDELAHGHVVALFPEGGSHDRQHMLPLKAGVALMALGAVEKYPELSVTIVPCGFTYSAGGHRFRSKAMADFGEPIVVDRTLIDQFRTRKRETVCALLAVIEAGLRSVTLNVPDLEFLETVLTVKRLYQPLAMVLTPAQSFELTHRFAVGLQLPAVRADPRFEEIRQDIRRYIDLADAHGYNPFTPVVIRRSLYGLRTVPQLLVVLVFALFAAVPGLLLNAPVGLLAKVLAERQAVIAVSKSTVKVKGLDVVASYKLIYIMILMPLWSGFLVTLVLWLTPLRWSVVLPGALLMPLFSYIGVRFFEQGVIWSRSVYPLLLRTLPSYRREEDTLLLLQASLRARICELADQLEHPFKADRIVPKDAQTADAAALESGTWTDDVLARIVTSIAGGSM